jgi:hypothetical protein
MTLITPSRAIHDYLKENNSKIFDISIVKQGLQEKLMILRLSHRDEA